MNIGRCCADFFDLAAAGVVKQLVFFLPLLEKLDEENRMLFIQVDT